MNGSDRLEPSLAALESALGRERAELLEHVKRVDRELEAVRTARSAGQRLGFGSVLVSSPGTVTANGGPVVPFRPARTAQQSPVHKLTTFPPEERSPVQGADLTVSVDKGLGPWRNDRAIPPAVEANGVRAGVHDAPCNGPVLQAVRNGVQDIVQQAARAGSGKNARRTPSAKVLNHGEPLAPSLRAILEAADRTLTTHEVAVAMLEERGLRYEGPKLIAVTSRVSALLSQDRRKRKVHAVKSDGSKDLLWVSHGNSHLLPPRTDPPGDVPPTLELETDSNR